MFFDGSCRRLGMRIPLPKLFRNWFGGGRSATVLSQASGTYSGLAQETELSNSAEEICKKDKDPEAFSHKARLGLLDYYFLSMGVLSPPLTGENRHVITLYVITPVKIQTGARTIVYGGSV